MKAPIMYSPMMGIGASIDLYTETPAVTIEDVMFDNTTVGELAPLESPRDYHDTWDLDGTDFTPEAVPEDEGFWDDFENVVLNGDYEEIGSELVTNGGFDVDANWSFIGTGSISNGVGVFPDTTNSFIIQSNIVPASVKTYKLVYEVTKTNEGTLLLAGGSSAFGTVSLTNTVGTHTKFVTSNGTQRNLQFANNGGFVGEIDNISLKQVDPNDRWNLGVFGAWSIEDGKAVCDGSQSGNADLTHNNLATEKGVQYEITYTISNYSAGTIKARLSSGNTTAEQSSNGTFTEIITAISTGGFRLRGNSTFVGSVDNVSVKEYAIKPLDV